MFSKKMLLVTPPPVYSQTSNNNNNNNNVRVTPTTTPFRRMSIAQIAPPATQSPIAAPKQKTATEGGESLHGKPMKWGEPTWFMFHTLSVKIKEENFLQVKNEFLNLVYSICTNLPCPICSDHAKEYLKTVNFAAIQTKQQLIDFFFQFHNMVNRRKRFEAFPREQVEEKYSKAITQNVVLYFIQQFKDETFNPKHISDQYVRRRVLQAFQEWYKNNAHYFLG